MGGKRICGKITKSIIIIFKEEEKMKSIFRKIAFVLALAMVVTLFPVMSASAAVKDNKYARSKNATLYVGGDANGDYESCWSASAKGKKLKTEEKYKIEYVSSEPSVATVSKYGLVEAKSVGTTTITVTFTKKGEKTIEESFNVTVKKNAENITLDKESQDALAAGLTTGDKVTLKAVQTDVDGSNEGITDAVKFYCSSAADKEIIELNKDTGELTALKEGKATIVVQSCQYEYDRETKKYKTTVATKQEYSVEVKEAKLVVQQTAWNAFEITFADEATAKAAVDETSKYFSSSSAAVTEKEDIVKVYKVLKNASNEKIGETAVIIGSISQRGNAKNIVDVTMFEELDQKADYVIRYKDKENVVTTAKNVAVKLTVSDGGSELLGEDTSKTSIALQIFTLGENGQLVNITGCKDYAYGDWKSSVILEEISNTLYHVEYNFVADSLNPVIYFYTKDASVSVNVKATFKDYFNEEKKGNELTDATVIHPGNHSFVKGEIMAWGITDEGKHHWDGGVYNSKEFAADDLGKWLIVDADIYYGNNKQDVDNCCDNRFSFRTENEDKLIVDKDTGKLFPPKEPKDGIVNIYVYYDDVYIGVCPVKVWAKRQFTNFTASVDAQKLSYNPGGDVDDVITLTMSPVDQLGAAFNRDMTVTFEVYGNDNVKKYIKFVDVDNEATVVTAPKEIWNHSYQVKIKANALPVNQVCSLRILCKATYNDGLTTKTLTSSVAFSAKDTSDSRNEAKNYQLITANEVDMKLSSGVYNNGKTMLQNKETLIKAYSLDRDGFKKEHLQLTAKQGAIDTSSVNADAGKNTVIVNQLNEYVDTSINLVQSEQNSRDLKFVPITTKSINVVSGSAIDGWASNLRSDIVTASAIESRELVQKIKTGNYQVSLFISTKADQRPAYKAGTVIKVVDSQPLVAWNWDKHSVSSYATSVAGVIDAIQEAFDFKKLDDNNVNIESNIYVGSVKPESGIPTNGNYTVVLSDDFVVQGDQVSVKQVRCIVAYKDYSAEGVLRDTYYYEMIIPINKSIRVGVLQ